MKSVDLPPKLENIMATLRIEKAFYKRKKKKKLENIPGGIFWNVAIAEEWVS